uniref:7 kDa protein n=1 Tax=Grapevine leafroll-associated virus 3 TaxID=55951 RepID=A0A2S0M2Y8_9CLOS|nr:7 kDa protein [Grapevine leafroll-associated virus 3]AXI81998.1 7 kDa protein [Grapevine leafroll-associated virus 3]AXI82010.1 7 kDa protein [Grapevine leafroll-associated virus 3]AXI82035.1 7 kDa protein [Grapevine leafroll-associated virus 3]
MRHLEKPIRVAIHYCVVRSSVCDSMDVFIGLTLVGIFVTFYLSILFALCTRVRSSV